MANIPISSFTAAANTTGIGMSGFSLTGSNAQSIIDLAGTWNTSGTPTGVKLNVTDTASNAASLLMDLQVGGVSQFKVSKAGDVVARSASLTAASTLANENNPVLVVNKPRTTTGHSVGAILQATAGNQPIYLNLYRTSDNRTAIGFAGNYDASASHFSINQTGSPVIAAGNILGWSNTAGTTFGATIDLQLHRDAANTLAQRNGVNAQTLRVYNTYTDASNYERGVFDWTTIANTLTIGTQSAGTGSTSRNVAINAQNGQILFTAGFNQCWVINGSSNFVAGVDNTFDIGASGVGRPRRFFLGGGSLTGTQADSSLTISPTWNTTGTPTAMLLNVTDTASNAASLLMDLQVGGASRFNVNKGGYARGTTGDFSTITYGAQGTNAGFTVVDTNFTGVVSANQYVLYMSRGVPQGAVRMRGADFFGWAPINAQDNADLLIGRDGAAGTFAQRNGVNAQTSRIYNTYTDASNYERGFMRWSSNVLTIGAEAAGTGTQRILQFTSARAGADTAWEFRSTGSTSPRFVLAGTDRSVTLNPEVNALNVIGGFRSSSDAGAVAALRSNNTNGTVNYFALAGSAAGVMQLNTGVGSGSGNGAGMEMFEMTAPAAPATDGVRIYAEDNGSGKTRLMARFATGAAVQIAIEP